MREVISIHVGQAGVRSGCSLWRMYFDEHGITTGKYCDQGYEFSDGTRNVQTLNDDQFLSHFEHNKNGTFSPRCILTDLDGSSIDKFASKNSYFNQTSLIQGKQDTGGLFADGYYSHKHILEQVKDDIRKKAERCDGLGSFYMHRNYGGGTGSGFGAQIQNHLVVDYGRKFTMDCILSPDFQHQDSCIVQPYNTIFGYHRTIDKFYANIIFENEQLYEKSLLYHKSASWDDINYLYSMTMSHLTSGWRFSGSLGIDLHDLTTLIAYPRIMFFVPSLAPLNCDDNSVIGLTQSLFDYSNCFVKCHSRQGLYMKIWMLYRGDVNTQQIGSAIQHLKQQKIADFVDWCPTGFKVGLYNEPPLWKGPLKDCPRSAVMLSNTTAVKRMFSRLLDPFDKLYSKRSFVHWYVGYGMEGNGKLKWKLM